LDEPPCCTTALDSAAVKLRYCKFTGSSCASTRLRDSTLWGHLSQTNLIVRYRSHPAEMNFVDAAKVNLRKRRSFIWRSAVPNLGVTCPPFFRCEAPRFYSSPYSSACASHVWITSGACHARRNRFRIDCQCSIGNLKAIPFSRAKKNTPLCSFSTIAVCA
jgi:hypothetical protein